MTRTGHTPGPWVETSIDGWDAVKPDGANLAICKLVENNPANARLIAAAPELLIAAKLGLENILADSGGIETEDSVIVRAAIAKATGQAA